MVFEIKGKVALITGGASGLGLSFGKALLQNDLEGLTIADINEVQGQKALEDLSALFGKGKVIFVKTDVTDAKSFEDAFKKTVDTFGNLDILINSAGILNDSLWEKEIQLNLNGTINGIILAMETYISQHRSGPEGIIVNISSIAGATPEPSFPIYSATKTAVLGATFAWGHKYHFDRTGVRVVAVLPGATETPLFDDLFDHALAEAYVDVFKKTILGGVRQKPEDVAKGIVRIIKKAPNGTAWICSKGGEPFQFKPTNVLTMEKTYLE